MAKRYYKQGEMVWLTEEKVKGKVVSLDTKKLEARVTVKNGDALIEKTVSFMAMDKLKTKKLPKQVVKNNVKNDTILFAKVRPDAIVPSKNLEDAGFDFYANLPARELNDGRVIHEMVLHAGKANLVPTGIACSLLPKYALNLKHERGSTGKYTMAVLSGLVDSGYRGEIFINIAPMDKDVVITDEITEVEEYENVVLYPYSKAIAQGTVDIVPELNVKEITLEQLQAIPSKRGEGKLGSSNK